MSDHYCHPHVHSSYSFKDGLNSPEQLVQRAVELGQPGIGITEHGHAYSAPLFHMAAAKHPGFKVIQGCEIYEAAPTEEWDPDPSGPHHAIFKEKWSEDKQRYYHLTLWAMNQTGWENLCAILTLSFSKAYKPKNQPLVPRSVLEQHSEGILVGLGCPQSRTNVALGKQGYEEAVKAAQWYFEVFGDRVYVEVMSALPMQVRALADQRRLAKHFGAKALGTNDVHYLTHEDGVLGGPHHMLVMSRKYQSVATTAEESSDVSDSAFGAWYGAPDFYLKNRQEMLQSGLFAEELDTSLEVLDRCSFNLLEQEDPQPPSAHVPEEGQDLLFDMYCLSHGHH